MSCDEIGFRICLDRIMSVDGHRHIRSSIYSLVVITAGGLVGFIAVGENLQMK